MHTHSPCCFPKSDLPHAGSCSDRGALIKSVTPRECQSQRSMGHHEGVATCTVVPRKHGVIQISHFYVHEIQLPKGKELETRNTDDAVNSGLGGGWIGGLLAYPLDLPQRLLSLLCRAQQPSWYSLHVSRGSDLSQHGRRDFGMRLRPDLYRRRPVGTMERRSHRY